MSKYLSELIKKNGIRDYRKSDSEIQTENNNGTLYWYLNRIANHIDMYCYESWIASGVVTIENVNIRQHGIAINISVKVGGFNISNKTIAELERLSGADYISIGGGKRLTFHFEALAENFDKIIKNAKTL